MVTDVSELIENMVIHNPEVKNDYVLVDELNGEINVKYLVKEKVDELCEKDNITPHFLIMAMMREQNKNINCFGENHKIIYGRL